MIKNRSFINFSDESFLQGLKHGLSDNGNCNDFNNEFSFFFFFFVSLLRSGYFLSVAYLTVANLARLGISGHH